MTAKIEHLVVLMMENRSFDHMLGYLKAIDGRIDGLTGAESNPGPDGTEVRVDSNAQPYGDLGGDPGHSFPDVNVQLFGSETAAPGADPTMRGFVQSYAKVSGSANTGKRIMHCFAPEKVPVLATLATQYAVCDRWFSSVPGPTQPNRMFAHAATSAGSVVAEVVWRKLRTIFEVLDEQKVSSRIYLHGHGSLLVTCDYLMNHQQQKFRDYDRFIADCQKGDLPAYTFIEPRYAQDGADYPTDQHPDNDVLDGEGLIHEVYDAIRSNETLWQGTLLVIVYDEHGGLYDHVAPPTIPTSTPVSADPPFDFGRLGLRVPAVFVSPWIDAGTVVGSTDGTWYEHASLVATIRALFAPNAKPLSDRDARAPTFHRILNRTTPRTDRVVFSATRFRPGANTAPPSDLVRSMVAHMADALAARQDASPALVPDGARLAGVARAAAPAAITTQQEASTFMRDTGARLLAGAAPRQPHVRGKAVAKTAEKPPAKRTGATPSASKPTERAPRTPSGGRVGG